MKVCFVGLGSIGKRHIRNLKFICEKNSVDLEVHALRNTSRKLEDDISSIISKSATSINDLDNDYDITFITNPTSLHYKTIEEFKDKSKNMFIEKPLFHSTDCKLDNLNLNKEGIYYIAAPMRYTNIIMELKNIIKNEKIYTVRNICSTYLPEWRKGVDYREVYSAKKELGGGISLDCIHEWDYLVYLFGFPNEVINIQGKYSDLEINSDDISIYIARYKDKLVELHLDYIGRESRREIELFTDKGLITADFIKNEIRFTYNEKIQFENDDDEIYIRELQAFFDMIQLKKKNTNDLEHAYKVLEIAKGER